VAYKDPAGITVAAVGAGVRKANTGVGRSLAAGFLAGAYIAFGGLLAIAVSSGMDPKIWGTLPTLFTGSVFALGLILTIIAGADLLTGNMALVPIAVFKRKVSVAALGLNFTIVLIGNLLGSLFVAYFLAVKSGVVTAELPLARLSAIATAKGVTETDWQIFLRAVGCNWLVCLAVWMALGAEDIGGKILAIFFPIMGFVAMGFDHVVANMFFLPAAIFAHVPGVDWGDALKNWVFAFLGNLVGAAVFVSGFYYYLYGRGPDPEEEPAPVGNGATTRSPTTVA
jgi:formate transporter